MYFKQDKERGTVNSIQRIRIVNNIRFYSHLVFKVKFQLRSVHLLSEDEFAELFKATRVDLSIS